MHRRSNRRRGHSGSAPKEKTVDTQDLHPKKKKKKALLRNREARKKGVILSMICFLCVQNRSWIHHAPHTKIIAACLSHTQVSHLPSPRCVWRASSHHVTEIGRGATRAGRAHQSVRVKRKWQSVRPDRCELRAASKRLCEEKPGRNRTESFGEQATQSNWVERNERKKKKKKGKVSLCSPLARKPTDIRVPISLNLHQADSKSQLIS